MRFPLLGKAMKWGAAVGLLLAAMSWRAGPNIWLLLNLAVAGARQYLWAPAFGGMVLLLNPVAPVFTPAGNFLLLLFLAGVSPILITCAAWRDASVKELA